jgi:preprotein translocase subunit Sec63
MFKSRKPEKNTSIVAKMDPFNLQEPQVRDYYADLGLPQQASSREIKVAFHSLAKKHHPDKKAPGKSIDAQDFREVSIQTSISSEDLGLINMTNQKPD